MRTCEQNGVFRFSRPMHIGHRPLPFAHHGGTHPFSLAVSVVSLPVRGSRLGEHMVRLLLPAIDDCYDRPIEKAAEQPDQNHHIGCLKQKGPQIDMHGQWMNGLANSTSNATTRQ